MVEKYSGYNIGEEQIVQIKSIAAQKYSKNIYDEYFKCIKTVEDLCALHSTGVDTETIVLGPDWFLCYTETQYYVGILDWVAIPRLDRLQQTIEMMGALRDVLAHNSDKLFGSDIRHGTACKLFARMIEKGLLKQYVNKCIIDSAAPEEVLEIRDELMQKYGDISFPLISEDSEQYEEYLSYVMHHITFGVTNKFIEGFSSKKMG